MKGDPYECHICEGIFSKTRTDEEAIAETEEKFGPNLEVENCKVICSDCFDFMWEIMMKHPVGRVILRKIGLDAPE